MPEINPRNILDTALKKALACGADQAEAVYHAADGVAVTVRLGAFETVERPAETIMGLRVYVGKKTTSLSTHDLRPEAVAGMAEKAVSIAKLSPENPYARLAGKNEFGGPERPDLEIFDPASPDPDELKGLALKAEETGLAEKGITNSEGASAGWNKSKKIHLTTRGFDGENQTSSFSLYTVLLGGEGTAMERDYDFTSARFLADLEAPEKIGRTAALRTLKRLGPRKIKSGHFPVIFDKRVSHTLLGHFSAAINGKSVAKGTTFLANEMGKPVFGKDIQIFDDPLRKRGLASRPFDGEGLAMKALQVVRDGVLENWLLDIASAGEMGLESNGRASRSLASPSSPGSTNLYLAKGGKTAEELMKEAGSGLLVTELIGMGVNGVTGDYSRGASGFWFEKGEVAFPVSEITIAGNLKSMFNDLIPANDLEFRQSTNAPSLLVPSMTVAGT